MRRIPFFRQINRDYCGPAVLKMVLAAHGITASQHALAKEAKTPRDPLHGTMPDNLVAVLKKRGFPVRSGNRKNLVDLRKALREDIVVIVCFTEPATEAGHYAIVREIREGKIFFLDPDARAGKASLSLEEFRRRWKDPIFTKTVRWAAFVGDKKE